MTTLSPNAAAFLRAIAADDEAAALAIPEASRLAAMAELLDDGMMVDQGITDAGRDWLATHNQSPPPTNRKIP